MALPGVRAPADGRKSFVRAPGRVKISPQDWHSTCHYSYSPSGLISNLEVAEMAKKALKKGKKLSGTKTLKKYRFIA